MIIFYLFQIKIIRSRLLEMMAQVYSQAQCILMGIYTPVFMGAKGFVPWGYAPAYIVHDWVFVAHHCGYESDNKYSFDDSVTVLMEGLKAVMQKNTEYRNYFVIVFRPLLHPALHDVFGMMGPVSLCRRVLKKALQSCNLRVN